MKTALILSGGGARAAYQVGVLRAVAELLPPGSHNPFPIICGTSAGAINAVTLAAHAGNFADSVDDLGEVWSDLKVGHIYRHSWWAMARSLSRFVASLFNEGVGRKRPISLLDNTPLAGTLARTVRFENIARSIEAGDLHAVSVSAMGYTSGESVSFFQGQESIPAWSRHRRSGRPTQLEVAHLLASSAIPTVFPTVRIGDEYFGDGALRQLAPISPALHLGADRIFVIGVSGNRSPQHWARKETPLHSPSIGQIIGHMFNSAFVDTLEGDIERMDRINKLLSRIPEEERDGEVIFEKPVESLVISPSKALDQIAAERIRDLPASIRFFLRTTGATEDGGGATAASYLLFAKSFCDDLMNLGYSDAMWEVDRIREFFQVGDAPVPQSGSARVKPPENGR